MITTPIVSGEPGQAPFSIKFFFLLPGERSAWVARSRAGQMDWR